MKLCNDCIKINICELFSAVAAVSTMQSEQLEDLCETIARLYEEKITDREEVWSLRDDNRKLRDDLAVMRQQLSQKKRSGTA